MGLKHIFDKCYCIQLVEDVERRNRITSSLYACDLLDSVDFWYVVRHPYDLEIGRYLKDTGRFHWSGKGNGGMYACTVEHYGVISQAYMRGFEHILIMEDDTVFVDKEKVNTLFSYIPSDYDIIRFAYCDEYKFKKGAEILQPLINTKAWGTGCYALSRKGMEYYISYMDNNYSVADMPLYDIDEIKSRGLKCYLYDGWSITDGNYKSNLR